MKYTSTLLYISITLSLVVLGFFILLMYLGFKVEKFISDNQYIVVELNDTYNQEGLDSIMHHLSSTKNINSKSIRLVTAEESHSEMASHYSQLDSLSLGGVFRDIIVFQLNTEANSDNLMDELSTQLPMYSLYNSIYHDEENNDSFNQRLGNIKFALGAISAIFIFITFIQLYSYITHSLSSYKDRLYVLDLVGATRKFIRTPVVVSALRMTLISCTFASLIIWMIISVLNQSVLDGMEIGSMGSAICLGALWIAGISLIMGTTYIIVNLYLSEFYRNSSIRSSN